jgi:hypothetical protein
MTTTLTRRAALAAVAAVPAVAALGSLPAFASEDAKLLRIIHRYRTGVDHINSGGGKRDEGGDILDSELDAVTDDLIDLHDIPALTAAGALAVFELLISERMVSVNEDWSDYMASVSSLARAVRGYLAGRVA